MPLPATSELRLEALRRQRALDRARRRRRVAVAAAAGAVGGAVGGPLVFELLRQLAGGR